MAYPITPTDWGRIYAYLFWLKTDGQTAKYNNLKKLFETKPRTAVLLIQLEMTSSPHNAPPLTSFTHLFEHWIPEDWENDDNKLGDIARGIRPNVNVIVRMCC